MGVHHAAAESPKILRLQHPKPDMSIETAKGLRPGVRSMEWFGETTYLRCDMHWTKYGSKLIPSMGICECGIAWKVGDATATQPQEPCATCVRKAGREHKPMPTPVNLYTLYICTYCGEAMCIDHVWFYGYGEDSVDICRACARERKLSVNREFDSKEY